MQNGAVQAPTSNLCSAHSQEGAVNDVRCLRLVSTHPFLDSESTPLFNLCNKNLYHILRVSAERRKSRRVGVSEMFSPAQDATLALNIHGYGIGGRACLICLLTRTRGDGED